MSTAPTEIDQIRQKMARIRRELHADAQGVVQSASSVTDWRNVVRTYPWAAVGLSVAVGYFVVPKRRKPKAESLEQAAGPVKTIVVERQVEPEKKKRGLAMTVAGWVAPLAWRAVQGYGMQFLTSWIEQQQANLQQYVPTTPNQPQPGPNFSGLGAFGNRGEVRR